MVVVNSVAESMKKQRLLCYTQVLLIWYIPSSGIAWVYDSFVYSFSRNILHRNWSNYHTVFVCLFGLCLLVVVASSSLFNIHSNKCKVSFHCGSNVNFSDYLCYGVLLSYCTNMSVFSREQLKWVCVCARMCTCMCNVGIYLIDLYIPIVASSQLGNWESVAVQWTRLDTSAAPIWHWRPGGFLGSQCSVVHVGELKNLGSDSGQGR